MDKHLENHFFRSMCQALIAEDRQLRSLFDANGLRYTQQHNGIGCLYETTMVYVVLKRLLSEQFPLKVSWEHPYPGQPTLHSDLALLDDNNNLDSLVEFKIWLSEDGSEVRSDVLKLKNCEFGGEKYLSIVELFGRDIESNAQWLIQQNPEAELVAKELFDTYCFYPIDQKLEHAPVNLYLLKIS